MSSAGFETPALALEEIQTYVSERFVPGIGICELLGHTIFVCLSLSHGSAYMCSWRDILYDT
jgi:hypothetical protein